MVETRPIDSPPRSGISSYRCHDRLLEHKTALFSHPRERWSGLFDASYDILLYDLISSYFEVDANGPVAEAGKLKAFGYSRDKRPGCLQIVIALIITPDGLPIGYKVMRGNTSDKTTLRETLKKITDQYGKEGRTWIMDRGIPTEEVLGEMRAADPSLRYLVGTPKGRLTKLEKQLAQKDWQDVKDNVHVKLLSEIQMLDVEIPTTDGRTLRMRRHTKPEKIHRLLHQRGKGWGYRHRCTTCHTFHNTLPDSSLKKSPEGSSVGDREKPRK